jgi:adenosylcobinamide-phosphate synthase
MTTAPAFGGLASPETLLVLLLALAIDAAVGDMPALFRVVPHPVRLTGRLIEALENRLNRERRSEARRKVRGLVAVLVLGTLAAALGWVIAAVSRAYPYALILELFVVVVLVAQRGLFDHVRAVAMALRDEGLEAGKARVGRIVGRDLDHLDEHGVARAAIESCAENFSDAVVAPAFWYILLGLPGLMLYKAVNTMDSMIGHRSKRYRAFGMAAARFDDLLNLVPARLSGVIVSTAALFTPTANAARALEVMIRDARKHSSPNAGWPEGAMAGALGLALAGPRRYGEVVADDPWIGDGRARATHRDINRALYLFVVACLVNAGAVALLAVLRLSL